MNQNMNLEQKIEAILFYKNEPVEIKKISKILEVDEETVKGALKNLSAALENRGICLIETGEEVALATRADLKEFIEKIAKDEMSPEIGKAGLETLAVILYNGPVSRREIDYLRGVNSTFILRNLMIRGLIEKSLDQNDQRIFKYKPTIALLAHLGVKNLTELPEFEIIKSKIENLTENTKSDNEEQT